MAAVRVLLVDDEALIRTGLRLLLTGSDGIEVVAEAGDGRQAVQVAAETAPDVVLMDIRMPGMDGLEATAALIAQDPTIKVMILTTFDNDATVLEALRLGAVGFLLKDTEPEDLIAAIRLADQGHIPLSPAITRRLVSTAVGTTRHRETAQQQLERLTERERAIAIEVARGATNQEIAAALFISLGTVKTHLGAIMPKLGASNRVQVALRCYEAGVV